MRIISKNKKIKNFKNLKLYLPKTFINKLSKFALFFVFLQLISLPLFIKYNKSTLKYFLGITSKKDLYIKSDFYKTKFEDFSNYINDLFNAVFTDKKLDNLYLNINLKNASLLDCKINNDCPNKIKDIAKGEIIFKQKKYNVRLSPKGMRKIHNFNFKNMSFRVNVKNNTKFLGMDKFSIQMPVIRGYEREFLVANLLKRANLLAPKNFYFKFYINGEYIGIRHVEEAVRKELIEAANYRYGPIFDLDQNNGDIYQLGSFNLMEKRKWSDKDNPILENSLNILERSRNNSLIFKEYFNNKKWAKYIAYMQAFETIHGSLPKSVKFFLNPIDGKFEPIFFDGHRDKWHKKTRLTDLAYKYSSEEDCKNNLLGSNTGVYLCNQLDWYKFLFGINFENTEFYSEFINTLEEVSSSKFINNVLKKEWDKLSFYRGNLYKELWRKDEYFNFGLSPYIASWSSLKSRLETIKNEVDVSKNNIPYIEFNDTKKTINILNNKSPLPQIAYLTCEDKTSEPIILLKDKKKRFDLSLLGRCDSKNSYISLFNKNKKYLINNGYEDKNFVVTRNSNQDSQISYSSTFSLNQKEILKVKKDELISAKNIIFSAGSKICLFKNSTLVLESDNIIFNQSNQLGGVSIESCDKYGGSLIIKNSNILAKDIYANNLFSPKNDLKELYGGINIINSNFLFKNIFINNSKSEDAINFIDSDVNGGNIEMINIKSDAIDLDNSTIKTKNIKCENIGNDCIDFSASIGKIDYIQANNIKDKVISLGEESNLNIKLVDIDSSEIGAVSKDDSILYITKFIYKNVNLPIVSFIKKSQFKSSIIKIKEIAPKNKNNYLISPESYLFINDKQFKSNKTSKEIKNSLYGNEFGVKTSR